MADKHFNPILTGSFLKGTGTLVARRFVKLDSNGKVVPFAAATDCPVGVLREATASTTIPVPVDHMGELLVEAGTGGVAIGDHLQTDANGAVVDATPANSEVVVGVALEAIAAGAVGRALIFGSVQLPSS